MTTRCLAIAEIAMKCIPIAIPPGVARLIADCCEHVSVHIDKDTRQCTWSGPLSSGTFCKLPRKCPPKDKIQMRSKLDLTFNIHPELGWQRVWWVELASVMLVRATASSLQALLSVVQCMQPHRHPDLQFKQRHHIKHLSLAAYLHKNLSSDIIIDRAQRFISECRDHKTSHVERPIRVIMTHDDAFRVSHFAFVYADRVQDWEDELRYVAKVANAKPSAESLTSINNGVHRQIPNIETADLVRLDNVKEAALHWFGYSQCLLCRRDCMESKIDAASGKVTRDLIPTVIACDCGCQAPHRHAYCSKQCRDLTHAIYRGTGTS